MFTILKYTYFHIYIPHIHNFTYTHNSVLLSQNIHAFIYMLYAYRYTKYTYFQIHTPYTPKKHLIMKKHHLYTHMPNFTKYIPANIFCNIISKFKVNRSYGGRNLRDVVVVCGGPW